MIRALVRARARSISVSLDRRIDKSGAWVMHRQIGQVRDMIRWPHTIKWTKILSRIHEMNGELSELVCNFID